jgi:DNA-binding NarL/FixJ family response regulator
MDQPLKVLIADDHKIFRDGLQGVIRRLSFIQHIKQAANGKEVLQMLAQDKFHLVFLDITMPLMDGIETAKIIHQKYPNTKIIALSMHHELEMVFKMIDAGVSGYLLKDAPVLEITKSIREVMSGNRYYTEEIQIALQNRSAQNIEDSSLNEELNEREKDVLRLICNQYSTKAIANKLFISTRTVDTYRISLLKKTKCKNTAGLVLFAVNSKLIN